MPWFSYCSYWLSSQPYSGAKIYPIICIELTGSQIRTPYWVVITILYFLALRTPVPCCILSNSFLGLKSLVLCSLCYTVLYLLAVRYSPGIHHFVCVHAEHLNSKNMFLFLVMYFYFKAGLGNSLFQPCYKCLIEQMIASSRCSSSIRVMRHMLLPRTANNYAKNSLFGTCMHTMY